MNLKTILAKNYVNFRGWSTDRKIVVIESDDWGSIRMPSKAVYEDLLSQGIPVDKSYFTKYDCLESEADLQALFALLLSYTDLKGNHPVITANTIVANPDFDKIELSGKQEYHYELMSETYKKYYGNSNVLALWKDKGLGNKLLWPQSHGREHLNVNKWMKAINASIPQENLAFEKRVLLGIGSNNTNVMQREKLQYMAAFEYHDEVQKKEIEVILEEGLHLFQQLFGFSSTSFVASCSVRGEHLDSVLAKHGVQFHQCGQQFIPQEDGSLKMINKFWGDINDYNQLYWRRNATFEPSKNPNENWAQKCMEEIQIAFRWGKPAVINSHRVNFSGGICTNNRENSLQQLETLLGLIMKRWPNVEFMTSDELGQLILKSKNHDVA